MSELTARLPRGYADTRAARAAVVSSLAARGQTGLDLDWVEARGRELIGHFTSGPKTPRPAAQKIKLAPGTRGPALERVVALAATRGLTVVAADTAHGIALSAEVPALDIEVRNNLAAAMKADPLAIELRCDWVLDGGDLRLDRIAFTRIPLPPARDRRITLLKELTATAVPDATPGWQVIDRGGSDVELRWGQRPELPKIVALEGLLPERYSPEEWGRLPVGLDARGAEVSINLKLGPHIFIPGKTNSGKSVAFLTLMAGAAARGHRLIVIDAVKSGVDFRAMEPWMLASGASLEDAAALLEKTYAEGQRRKEIILREGAVKWADLSDEVRASEGIFPISLALDEFANWRRQEEIPKGLPKDDPMVLEIQGQNYLRARVDYFARKIAAELRFAGIHLWIATQDPTVDSLGSSNLRNNLPSTLMTVTPGRPPKRDQLTLMGMASDTAESAFEALSVLDDGVSPGLAVQADETGQAQVFKVGFSPQHEIPALLDARGIPRLTEQEKWHFTPASPPEAPPQGGKRGRGNQSAQRSGNGQPEPPPSESPPEWAW